MNSHPVIRYFPETDTMAIELRPWPEVAGDQTRGGGDDAGEDLVIHYAPDGEPWLWEIEHASAHPEHTRRLSGRSEIAGTRRLDRMSR